MNKTASAATKLERLDFRILTDEKRLIERAALLLGQTVSAFATSALTKSAMDIIKQHQETKLSQRDAEIFLSLLEANEEPNDALKAAARRYKKYKHA